MPIPEVAFFEYVRNVRSTAQAAVVLAARLEKAAPGDLTPAQRKSLRNVVATANDAKLVQSERDRLAPGKLRPLITAFANDWGGVLEALRATGRIPASVSDFGARARQLEATLFPDGISFVQQDAETAWSEGQRRLDRLEEEHLERELNELIGSHFIVATKKSTAALADAIGTGKKPRPIPSSTALAEALLRFGRACGAYGRAMAAEVDEDDEESVARFLRAMAPFDAHRARSGGGGASDAGEPTEPDAPAEPTVVDPLPVPEPAPVPVS